MNATSPATKHRWSAWQIFFLLLGVVLLGVLIGRVGVRALLAQALAAGWYFAAAVVLFSGVHILRTLSWRLCLNEHGPTLRFRSLLSAWLGGEAVSHLSFAWSGEALRAASTRSAVPVERGLAAQVVSRALFTYASLCWVAVGFLLIWWTLRPAGALYSLMLVGTLATFAVLLLSTVALVARGRMVAPFRHWLERRERRSPLGERLLTFLRVLESDLALLIDGGPSRLITLLALNWLASLAGVAEVYLLLRGLGATPTFAAAFVIEALTKLLGVFSYLVPGNVGVREGGTVAIVSLFGLAAVTGLNLALIRRARALVWVAVGALLLIRQGLSPLTRDEPSKRETSSSRAVTREQLPATKS